MVQQVVLDGLGRWAERATGLRALHGKTGTDRLATPYVSLEMRRRPVPKTAQHVREVADMYPGGRLVLTAAEGDALTVRVNLAWVRLVRGVGESLDTLAGRVVAALTAPLAGRVTPSVDGADVVLTALVLGDLWRLEVVEGATASYEGETAPARLCDRLWSVVVRVRLVGAAATSGQAGIAGDGNGAAELLAALQEALDEPWAFEILESFGMRRTEEATEAPAEERRANALLEDRSYFDLVLGVSTRYARPTEAASKVSIKTQLNANPPNPDPLQQVLDGLP